MSEIPEILVKLRDAWDTEDRGESILREYHAAMHAQLADANAELQAVMVREARWFKALTAAQQQLAAIDHRWTRKDIDELEREKAAAQQRIDLLTKERDELRTMECAENAQLADGLVTSAELLKAAQQRITAIEQRLSWCGEKHCQPGGIDDLQAKVTELEAELGDLKLSLWCPLALSCFLCGKGPLLPEQLAVRWRDSLLGVCFPCRDARAKVTALEAELEAERMQDGCKRHRERVRALEEALKGEQERLAQMLEESMRPNSRWATREAIIDELRREGNPPQVGQVGTTDVFKEGTP